MKQTKFLAMIMAALVLGMTTSCGDDPDPTPSPTPTPINGTSLYRIIKDKNGNAVQLDEFTFTEIVDGNSQQHKCKYYYEAGKLYKMIDEIDGSLFKPTAISTPFKVSFSERINNVSYDQQSEYKLDGNGDIVAYSLTQKKTEGTASAKTEESATFTYDGAKQISRVTIAGKTVSNFSGVASEDYSYTIDFTWVNGNPTKAFVKSTVNGLENTETRTYSYNTSVNLTSNQMPYTLVQNCILGGFSRSQQLRSFIPLIGFGLVPKNVPYSFSVYTNSSTGVIQSETGCAYKYATSN